MPAPRLEDELAAVGPFFAVEVVDGATAPTPPWRPVSDLVTDPTVLRSRVTAVREVLARTGGRRPGEVQLRVAASTAHLGLVARLVGPLVAAAALGSLRVDPRIENLWWQDRLGAPVPLAVRAIDASPDEASTSVPGTAVEAVTVAVERAFGVPPQVLWGNVGSAANTAAMLVAAVRPDLGRRAMRAADALLADRRVEGGRVRSGPGFRRRSCCLIYRVTNDRSTVCGDCILRR